MLTHREQIQKAKSNDQRLRKIALGKQQPTTDPVQDFAYRQQAGRARQAVVEGQPTNTLTAQRQRMTQQRLSQIEQAINAHQDDPDRGISGNPAVRMDEAPTSRIGQPEAKIPASPGQSGSSGVYRTNTGQRLSLSLQKEERARRRARASAWTKHFLETGRR